MNTGGAKAAEDALLQASRYASAYFERFDKSNLYHAAIHRDTDWLLSESASAAPLDHEPCTGPLINNLPPPDENGRQVFNKLEHETATMNF